MVALMARLLPQKGYSTVVIDGDASNPGGLARLIFGSAGPKPLFEFFGGREKVTCPVDDPSPLTRVGQRVPVPEQKVALEEIPSEYSLRKHGVVLFQIGKMRRAYEGCDGPMSKATRDFIVGGEEVTLIDVEAGESRGMWMESLSR
jgi:CO dehydrogenase maturation factor